MGARASPRQVETAPEPSGRASSRPTAASVSSGVASITQRVAQVGILSERGGVGRGASRGRQEREAAIFTRPSKEFDKKGI